MFEEEVVIDNTGVVFDGLPGKGTLMARKKAPVTPGETPACAADVDWAEPVKKGRTYALDEFTEFYVAFAEEDKPEAAGAPMPTWDSLLSSEEFEVG